MRKSKRMKISEMMKQRWARAKEAENNHAKPSAVGPYCSWCGSKTKTEEK